MQGKFIEDLKRKIKKKYDLLKADNTRNVEHAWQTFLSNLYTSIEQTVKNGQYASFESYIQDISNFLTYASEHPPITADGTKIISEFCFAAI
jgi:hypothetical protein